MIKPTNGRVVLFQPAGNEPHIAQHDHKQLLTALITHVWSDHLVNLAVFDSNGTHHQPTSVQLLQDDDEPTIGNRWCEWMPFQKGQAVKTEAVEQKLAGA